MPITVDIEVKGLIESQRKAEKMIADLRGTPVLNAMRDSTLKIEREAKLGLVAYQGPTAGGVDTGRLRASITPEVFRGANEIYGIVGTNVEYAPYVEFGTRPHWPPLSALEVWASRHHTTAYLVALGISRHGTAARKFLTNAFEKSKDYINARFERAYREILK